MKKIIFAAFVVGVISLSVNSISAFAGDESVGTLPRLIAQPVDPLVGDESIGTLPCKRAKTVASADDESVGTLPLTGGDDESVGTLPYTKLSAVGDESIGTLP